MVTASILIVSVWCLHVNTNCNKAFSDFDETWCVCWWYHGLFVQNVKFNSEKI